MMFNNTALKHILYLSGFRDTISELTEAHRHSSFLDEHEEKPIKELDELRRKIEVMLQAAINKAATNTAELQDKITELELEVQDLKEQLEQVSDTCKKCGCTEFLCGHNKR